MKSWSNRVRFAPLTIATLAGIAAAACNTKELDDGPPFPSTSAAPLPGPQPTFTVTRSLDHSPPPISGGTLTIAPDGNTAIAADPDRDRIYVVDLAARAVKYDIQVGADSEPGRVAVDANNKAHVALRRGGSVVTIDLANGNKTEQKICAAPRGIAYAKDTDTIHVACAEGLLVSIPQNGGAVSRVALDRDLRDVMVTKSGNILVSRFRTADVLVLNSLGELQGKSGTRGGNLGWRIAAPPTTDDGEPETEEPAELSQDPVNPVGTGTASAGYYGSGSTDACSAPTITSARLDIPGQGTMLIPPAVLPVDLATNGREYAIVAAGNGHTPELPQIFIHSVRPGTGSTSSSGGSFGPRTPSRGSTNTDCLAMTKGYLPNGQAIAAAFAGKNGADLIVQSREPASLFIMTPDRKAPWKEIKLSTESREDTGHAIFHSNSGGFLACASCHAEGGDDGRTWLFVEGERRTPSMMGTMRDTEGPFHWDGSMRDMRHLVEHVFVSRMSGPHVDDAQVETLKNYLVRIPEPVRVEKPADAVNRGAVLFKQRGCEGCHTGANLTNHTVHDVGTGGMFKVPSLVGVAWRAPFIHNGCARTLAERFTACGGDKHGDIAGLTKAQIDDLATYLESL